MLQYDVLLEIFKYLDFKTIAQCATLCRTFYNISNESVVYNRVTFKVRLNRPYYIDVLIIYL